MPSSYATYEIEENIKASGYNYIVGVDEAGRGCEHPDAEVLTKTGWKYYKELTLKDSVMSYTPEGFIEWQPIYSIIEKDFDGEMADLSNSTIHINVTPDHYFDVVERDEDEDFKFVGRTNVLDLKDTHCIPRGGTWIGEDREYFSVPGDDTKIPMETWIPFLGVYFSFGVTFKTEDGRYTVIVLPVDREGLSDKVYEVCKKLPFSVYKTTFGVLLEGATLYTYLKSLGYSCNRYIPEEFKKLSFKLLNTFIEWMLLGKDVYRTVSVALKDDIEEVLLKIGKTSHTQIKLLNDAAFYDTECTTPCFEMEISQNCMLCVKDLNKRSLPYVGKVFCLSLVQYHNFYVRRNGTGYFTGNCGAGPVVAGAVHVPDEAIPALLFNVKDSKKLTANRREELFNIIRSTCHVGVGVVSNQVIDDINILEATKLAMEEAVHALNGTDYVIIDGTVVLRDFIYPQKQIVKGDTKSISIAAASIIAKVTRDRIMMDLHSIFSFYGFDKHKGYLTKQHVDAIQEYGTCELHRMTFRKVGK